MAIVTVDDLIQVLRQRRLLEPEQLTEVLRLPGPPSVPPRALAGQLIQRGWLSPYQVNQIFLGRDRDLVLGSYVLLERLGEGGMGQVYKARHARLGRIVALKLIHRERLSNPRSVRRFHREIQAVARLSHPNIVHALDADQDGDTHFLVMEFVEGIDLGRLVKERGPLPVPLACDCIRQAALGLQHVHENKLVHRDIKPHNLLLAGDVLKVLDLGLARLNQRDPLDPASSGLTRQGFLLGTADYVAPEQAVNSRLVDIRADLYSLGCTLYHLLSGHPPFAGDEPLAKLVRHQSEEAVPIERLRPDTPPKVAALLRRLMAKRREDRPQTPAELASALTKSRPNGSLKQPQPAPSLPPLPKRSFHRWRRPLLTGVGAVLVLVLCGWLLMRPSGSESSPPVAISSPPPAPPPIVSKDPPREITNSLGMKLVRIPAGEFVMGSPSSEPRRAPNEGPPRRIVISQSFYLGAHLVTVGEFRAFVEAAGHSTKTGKGDGPNWRNPGWQQTDAHPVPCLSWHDVKAFCDWLGEKEDRKYRLPTEVEWEYACRAGSPAAYSFGDDPVELGEHAWFAGNSHGQAHPVGQRKPNAWGLYDMHGNLFQWCDDWYDPHLFGPRPEADKQEPRNGTTRVQRGGSWKSAAADCRCARRIWDAPHSRRNDRGGFRVLLVPAEAD